MDPKWLKLPVSLTPPLSFEIHCSKVSILIWKKGKNDKCFCIYLLYHVFPVEFKEYFWAFFCFMSAFMTLMECRTSNGMQIFVKCFVLVKKVGFFSACYSKTTNTKRKKKFICAMWIYVSIARQCYILVGTNKQLSCLFICILFMLMIVDIWKTETKENKWKKCMKNAQNIQI